ncbi:MAG: hypothetical protein GYA87_09995 [Christensenellaceae bacterium]|nr:hypothetical protein [Christensenellaceae bacterium]
MINIFYNYFDKNKDSLINKIKTNNEVTNVQNVLNEFLKDMYFNINNNISSDLKPFISLVVNGLIKAVPLMVGVDNVKLLKKEETKPKLGFKTIFQKYMATIVCVAFAIYFFFDGKLTPMISAIFLGFLSLIIQTFKNEKAQSANYEYIFMVNQNKLINTLGEYFSNADNELVLILSKKTKQDNSINWDGKDFLAIQMLYEAIVQKDGDYSLKAANQLISNLQNRKINFEYYSDKNKEYFDIFPGVEDNYTIRPALMYENKLILKGQATVKQVINNG